MLRIAITFALISILAPSTSNAQESEKIVRWVTKKRYTLLNPTPRLEMRELSTDRPDATESPYPVDAGHIQLEMSFFEYSYDQSQGIKTVTLGIAPINLKVGLLNNLDVQFLFTPYERVLSEVANVSTKITGFSDNTQLRFKLNLGGLEGESAAFALMPFIKFPTGSAGLSNDRVEGGLILPIALPLPADWGLGLMAELDYLYDSIREKYGFGFIHTGAIGHDLPWGENFGGFIEYIGIISHVSNESYAAVLSAGLTKRLSEDIQIDGGARLGLTESADDYALFTGITFRR